MAAADSSSDGSITRLIHDLQRGDLGRLNPLMQRIYQSGYYQGALERAEGHLGPVARQGVSGEDVLQESLEELFKRARRGRLETVDCRERLFGLLELIIRWKARDHRRSAERPSNSPGRPIFQDAGADSSSDSAPSLLARVGDSGEFDPVQQAIVADVFQHLLKEVEQKFGQYPWVSTAVQLLIEGCRLPQIATECGRTQTEIRNLIETLRQTLKSIYRDDWENIKRQFRKKPRDRE